MGMNVWPTRRSHQCTSLRPRCERSCAFPSGSCWDAWGPLGLSESGIKKRRCWSPAPIALGAKWKTTIKKRKEKAFSWNTPHERWGCHTHMTLDGWRSLSASASWVFKQEPTPHQVQTSSNQRAPSATKTERVPSSYPPLGQNCPKVHYLTFQD